MITTVIWYVTNKIISLCLEWKLYHQVYVFVTYLSSPVYILCIFIKEFLIQNCVILKKCCYSRCGMSSWHLGPSDDNWVEKYLFYFPKILVLGVMSTTLPPSVTHIQYYTGHLTIILHKHEKFTFPVKKYWIIYTSMGWVNVSVWESEYIWNVAM